MNRTHLQDRVARGLGQAAQRIGDPYDVFRPKSAFSPLSPDNRILRLPVAIHGEDKDWHRGARYGQPLWFAVLDTGYTQPGDYLTGPDGIFFIASQPALLPTVCVQTNSTITLSRAEGANTIGVNAYGGVEMPNQGPVLVDWPASMLVEASGSRNAGALPGEPGPASWTILLPALPAAEMTDLRADDLVRDATGLTAVITAVERSPLGWRLTAVQAVT
ncbi:hypothetical protein ACELLULO517_09205 [Acidisoma cellulosilytica]|uniref:Uncharacterized protein n=1 Tax=Acidisoma cellulosilyticum TaxID=2802395 RepID=A0A963Z089_9PROT|nr:hypothetical protein [Acidisoma cellulosilyticum]MCB8880408.1 hypothetical protein [Acidisoma cellulosilyticum]